MLKYEDECVGCSSTGLPCLGAACPNRNVPRHYCDECGNETKLYEYDDRELCADCVLESLKVVEGTENAE